MRDAFFILTAIVVLGGQELPDVRRLYDAGKYKDVVATVEKANLEDESAPRLQYIAAQSQEKLKDENAARQMYQRLAESSREVWAEVGRSALALLDKELDEALKTAKHAVELESSLPEAHYQQGLALMFRREYGDAARAFDEATDLDQRFAAAHYYAGLNFSRIKRIDLMANHFEAFLKLAPNAPERPEVESIMRTVRGR